MFYVILKNIKEVAPVKTIIYSPSEDMTDENTFFESMEAATEAGGDILIFPENVYTPYNKFLNSVDILSADEYDTVLDCLYEFCTELGCAAVFNATDDFGFNYSIFANPMAQSGETYNKLYLKHSASKLTCFDLEDYDKCICELFEPIIYRGRKIGLFSGEDIFLPHIFNRYGANGVDLMLGAYGLNMNTERITECARKISAWKNIVVAGAGFDGNYFCASAKKGLSEVVSLGYSLYGVEINNSDYTCGYGEKPVFEETGKYVGNNLEKYELLQK